MSELIKALVAARKEIGGAKKDKINPAFKSKYADLAAVIEAVKEPLEKQGLTFVQDIADDRVVTVIMHSAGETLRLAPFPIIAAKPDAQGHGSALTYARRYSLQTALGVPAEDDDGNAASKPADVQRFPTPVKSALEGVQIDKETNDKLARVASSLVDLVAAEQDGTDNSYQIWELVEAIDEDEEKLHLWHLLGSHSKVRARIKKIGDEQRAKDKKKAESLA